MSHKLFAAAVADLIEEIGLRTALLPGNHYKSKAYLRAAENLRALAEPLESVVARGALQQIPGVGGAIASVITSLQSTGSHPLLDKLRAETPGGVFQMMRVPGLRPDKVLAIYNELGIASLAELEQAARAGHIAKTKSLGEALQRKVLQGIEALHAAAGRRHVHRAAEMLSEAEQQLRRRIPGLKDLIPVGDLRRGCELVGDLVLVATMSGKPTTAEAGGLKLHITDRAHRGITLLCATGSPAHLEQLRARAEAIGYRLDERGLHTGKTTVAATEKDIYATLGLPFIEPELREGNGEIELASRNRLPKLVQGKDIRGVLHAHTTESDGVDTLDDMAEAVRSRGYRYFGVSDHSQSAHYAGGLRPEQIESQHAAVDRLNQGYGGTFFIFKGIESDIREDGSLDYQEEILSRFDFIIASVHSKFRLDEAVQTARIIRAISNPYTTILGHMTGRQLLRRPGYEVDIDAVLRACATRGVVVEINANPWRLDLDWRWHRRALELGCMMSINPDAHSTAEIDMMRWGVAMARKGGISKDRILNCLHLRGIQRFLAKRRQTVM